jgi:hypothetical protein
MSWRPTYQNASLVALIAAILLFYAFLIRSGATWADDWATYIQGAVNLLHGNKYDLSGYIINPQTNIGPTAYPPLYSMMLVLPVAIWGINLYAIQMYQLIGWGVFLYFLYWLSRRRLSFALSLLAVAATGFSPYFFAFKDYITSESLFVPLLYITFVVAARYQERFYDGRLPVSAGLWLGLLITLCIWTRSIGIVLIPALLLFDLFHFHRFRLASVVASIIPTIAFPLQFLLGDFLLGYFYGLRAYFRAAIRFLSGSGSGGAVSVDAPIVQTAPHGSMLEVLSRAASAEGHRLSAVVGELSRFWGHGADGDLVARIATVIFIGLAIYGFAKIKWRQIMYCDLFVALYAIALLVLPPELAGARMQLPIVPLFYIYVFIAVEALARDRMWVKHGGIAVVVALGAVSYWHAYRNANFRVPLEGIETTQYHDMFDYIRTQTEADSTFIFDKPRTFALYTGRRAAAVYNTRAGSGLIGYMHTIGARYILFYDDWYNGTAREVYVQNYFGNRSGEFEVLHDSGHYVLYKMKTGR